MSSDPPRRKKKVGASSEQTRGTKAKPRNAAASKKPVRDAESPLDATIGVSEAKRLLGWTPRFIQQLVADGYIKKSAHGTYVIINLVHGAIAWLKDEDRRGSKSAAAGRLKDVRSAEIEQRMALRSGEMVDQAREETLRVVDQFAGSLLADLLGLPAQVTKDLELRRKLGVGIREAFDNAAKRARDPPDRN